VNCSWFHIRLSQQRREVGRRQAVTGDHHQLRSQEPPPEVRKDGDNWMIAMENPSSMEVSSWEKSSIK